MPAASKKPGASDCLTDHEIISVLMGTQSCKGCYDLTERNAFDAQ